MAAIKSKPALAIFGLLLGLGAASLLALKGCARTPQSPPPVSAASASDGGDGPVIVPALQGAASLSIGSREDCAVLRTGRVRCLRTPKRNEMVDIQGVDDAVFVDEGCALRRNGQVVCWSVPDEAGKGAVVVPGVERALRLATTGGRACVVRAPGEVLCWELDSQSSKPIISPMRGIVDAIDIGAGNDGFCVVRREGQILCWGKASYGTLSDAHDVEQAPSAVPDLSDAVEVALGGSHACALRTSGEVACWGEDPKGELGRGTAGLAGGFAHVQGIDDAVSVSTGEQHACALRRSGEVWCWGNNEGGELGDGTRTSRDVPKPVPGLNDVVRLSAHSRYTCAVRKTGEVMCWGAAVPPRGVSEADTLSPTRIPGLRGVVDISLAWHRACALLRSGKVSCWGQLDFNSAGERQPDELATIPWLSDAVAVSLGNMGSCAVRRAGTLLCWGKGAITAWVPPGPATSWPPENTPDPTRPTSLRRMREVAGVSVYDLRACLWQRSGKVHCWNHESFGMLPENPLPKSAQIEELDDAIRIVDALIVRISGSLAATSTTDEGKYGAQALFPEVTDVTDASGSDFAGCAVRRSGHVICWGEDTRGQLGAGNHLRSRTPVRVVDFP